MARALPRFAVCSGWQGICPWKRAHGTELKGSKKCLLCSAESLTRELSIRRGQDLISALTKLKDLSENDYNLALERLDNFGDGIIRADFESRVRRTNQKRTMSVLREAAAADPAPAALAPEAGGERRSALRRRVPAVPAAPGAGGERAVG